MNTRKRIISVLVATAVGLSALAIGQLAANTAPNNGSHTDPSGLTVIYGPTTIPDGLTDAWAAAYSVAQNKPDDFGYPAVQGDAVFLPPVSAAAIALSNTDPQVASQQLQEYARTLWKDGTTAFEPSIDVIALINLSAPPGKPYKLSATQIDQLINDIFDARDDPSLKKGGIYQTSLDASGRILVTLRKLTPAVASSLVEKYGADNIVIRIDPNFHSGPV